MWRKYGLITILMQFSCLDSTSNRSSCEEACRICNLSEHELRSQFGTTEIPSRYGYAMKYVDNEGYKAYSYCLMASKMGGGSPDISRCELQGQMACVTACKGSNGVETLKVVETRKESRKSAEGNFGEEENNATESNSKSTGELGCSKCMTKYCRACLGNSDNWATNEFSSLDECMREWIKCRDEICKCTAEQLNNDMLQKYPIILLEGDVAAQKGNSYGRENNHPAAETAKKKEIVKQEERRRAELILSASKAIHSTWDKQVSSIFEKNRNQYIDCYEKRMPRTEDSGAGMIEVSLVVDEEGKVSEVTIEEETINDREVALCIVEAIRRMRLPKPEDGDVQINYKLQFVN